MTSLSNANLLPAKNRPNASESRDVAPGPSQTLDQPERNGIGHGPQKNDWNCRCGVFSSSSVIGAGGDNHVNFKLDQLISQGGKPVEIEIRRTRTRK